MDEIYAIECETIQAQYDVLCAEMAIFEKYHNMVNCVGVLNYDRMNQYIQESTKDSDDDNNEGINVRRMLVDAFIPPSFRERFKNKNGKYTPLSIIQGFIKLFISICTRIVNRFKSVIDIKKVTNDKCTHLVFPFDLNEYIEMFVSMRSSIQFTNNFWKDAFGTTKKGNMKRWSPRDETLNIDTDHAASMFINKHTADNKSFETKMLQLDVDRFNDRINQLHPTEYMAFDKFAKISNKAINDVKKTNFALKLSDSGEIWYTTDGSDPLTSSTARKYTGVVGEDENKEIDNNSKLRVYKYAYEKKKAISIMTNLNTCIGDFKKSLKDIIKTMENNLTIVEAYQKIEGSGDEDEYDDRRSDFSVLHKVLKADVDIYQQLLKSILDFQMFLVGRYGPFCIPLNSKK